MKPRTPTGIKVLRTVSIAISLISFLVLGTVVYSAYTDYKAVQTEFGGTGGQRPTLKITMQGVAEVFSLNVTVPNRGVYALTVSLSCDSPSPNIICDPATVTVPAGQEKVLRFQMTINDYAQYLASGNRRINGTVGIQMLPFVTLSIGTDLGSLASQKSA